MILDNLTLLSGAISTATGALVGQAVAGTNTSVLGTNAMDLGPLTLGGNQLDNGSGAGIYIAFSVLTAPSTGTSVQFQLIQADDAALTTNVEVLAQTDAIAIAKLPINTMVPLHCGRVLPFAPRRYIGVRYGLVGSVASMTALASMTGGMSDRGNIYKGNFAIL